jgi:hypothetical protein
MLEESAPAELRFAIRSDAWERTFVVVFYLAVLLIIFSSISYFNLGLLGAAIGIGFVPVSMFCIFSSPTTVWVEPAGPELVWERRRLYLPITRRIAPADMSRVVVTEPSARKSSQIERDDPKVDITYFSFVEIELQSGKRLRIFGSGTNLPPREKKRRAAALAERISEIFNVPVESRYRHKR